MDPKEINDEETGALPSNTAQAYLLHSYSLLFEPGSCVQGKMAVTTARAKCSFNTYLQFFMISSRILVHP